MTGPKIIVKACPMHPNINSETSISEANAHVEASGCSTCADYLRGRQRAAIAPFRPRSHEGSPTMTPEAIEVARKEDEALRPLLVARLAERHTRVAETNGRLLARVTALGATTAELSARVGALAQEGGSR